VAIGTKNGDDLIGCHLFSFAISIHTPHIVTLLS
jgi:hypothetical protein